MRVLFLVDRVLPVGASGIAAIQMKCAKEAGHNVSLVTTSESRIDIDLQPYIDDVIYVKGLGNKLVGNLRKDLEVAVNDLVSRVDLSVYDVAVSHNFGRFGGVSALAEVNKILPLILWCHDEYPWSGYHYEFQNYNGALVRTYEPWDGGRLGNDFHLAELRRLRNAAFVSPSLWLHERIDAVTANCSGIFSVHIPNAIELDVFRRGEASYGTFVKTGRQLRVLCVGSLHDARKNIVYALRELGRGLSPAQAKNTEIILVGANPDGYVTPSLVRLDERFPKSRELLTMNEVPRHIIASIHLAGWVNSQGAMATLYRDTGFVLHLSQAENYPTVCLEARASGVRVIASDAGGTKETLGTGDILIPLPLTDGAVMRSIQRLVSSYGDPPIIDAVEKSTDLPVSQMWDRIDGLIRSISSAA
jgi:glycosyltransferase involved in cell wall biosynthesis